MKKLMVVVMVALAATTVLAQAKTKKSSKKAAAPVAAVSDDEATTGKGAKVNIVQEPKLGQTACLLAPSVSGASIIGQCYKKPRQWIVLETKYDTFGTEKSYFLDQLTFTWHVLLESKSASVNKGNKEGLAPYSYFTASTTYFNIPTGQHAASVVLPPSYLERYGEPKVVGLEITNQNGEMLAGDCWSDVKGIVAHKKFWEDSKIMDAPNGADGKMIERRQGLVDRSKTIWALVNPNDYEATLQ